MSEQQPACRSQLIWLNTNGPMPARIKQHASIVAAPDEGGASMLSVLIGVLIICIVGAICFWAIDKFINEARLANLLKLLVVLICLAAILQRVLPLAGITWL
jgi:hypothetical protein